MPKRRRRDFDWEDVRDLFAALPGVECQPTGPGVFPGGVVRSNKRLLAYPVRGRVQQETGEQGEFVWLRTGEMEKAALLQENPASFFVTPHFMSSPGVIVRLAHIDEEHLRELILNAWRTAASKRMLAELDEAGR
jgi:hypothetical protein